MSVRIRLVALFHMKYITNTILCILFTILFCKWLRNKTKNNIKQELRISNIHQKIQEVEKKIDKYRELLHTQKR